MAHLNDNSSPDVKATANTAVLHPQLFVLDSTNVDLLSWIIAATAVAATVLFHASVVTSSLAAAALIVPLRALFPIALKPQGLALITGAASGIGKELALVFASNGHDLLLVDMNSAGLETVKTTIESEHRRRVTTFTCDLTQPGGTERLYDDVKERGLVVDVLVNCAGIGHVGAVLSQPPALARRLVSVNCIALAELTRLFGADMATRRRGWILQVGSIAGMVLGEGMTLYHASKHFVSAYSDMVAVELRGTGVRLTQIMPGTTRTPLMDSAHAARTLIFSAFGGGLVEDARDVARVAYDALCKGRRHVFSSWNASALATIVSNLPRSVHLTVAVLWWYPVSSPSSAAESSKS